MKVERIEPPPVEVKIQIEVGEKTAEMLCALLGGIKHPSAEIVELFNHLNNVLPNREDSFGDYFEIRNKDVWFI